MLAGREVESLHPLLTHHVVNTLGWRSLRPFQTEAITPILRGDDALLIAPTAGGKTEAAIFPVLSRMLEDDWQGLSVLYLCPLRALLNNLHPRIDQYATMVGRRAGLWHGDVGEAARERIRSEPPDVLLTTPESIEAMLISRKTDHEWLFQNLQAVVVDEIHAFAGDDRGWHLLAVTQRLQQLADRTVQRIGLSATVGNPDELVGWLSRGSRSPQQSVVQPSPDERVQPEVTVDYVGSLGNAAQVISRLHRGEKRLVFVDSRARVEELALELRALDVTTFLSHGSLGREERHAAEQAFAESRDCVIVATSTLELGIDVGDLDRVIQLDAPATVGSFLQRLGRTGRREGLPSNLLFLATSDDAFLQALGLCLAWETGFVEPLTPPAFPVHLLLQQMLALLIQEGGLADRSWRRWLGEPMVLGADVAGEADRLVQHLLDEDVVHEDNHLLWLGPEGERRFGRRNFLDLMAVFTDAPLMKVLHGRAHLGQVPSRLLVHEEDNGHVLLLGGRSWQVRHVDWKRRVVQVEPAEDRGRARWFGQGRGLSFEICQQIRRVLAGADPEVVKMSERSTRRIGQLRQEHWWIEEGASVVTEDATGGLRWWTFAGLNANVWLSSALGDLRSAKVPRSDLSIRLDDATIDDIDAVLSSLDIASMSLAGEIAEGAIENLKFGDLLPVDAARGIVERRLRDDQAVRAIQAAGLRHVHL